MKIFFASPFSQFCEEDSDIILENRWFFEKIIKFFKENNLDYFCSQEREEWGEKYISPSESIIADTKAISECDLFLAIPGNPISGGVHVEIGWASNQKKKMIVFLDKNLEYSPMIMGLKELTECEFVYYEDLISDNTINLIINKIKEVLNVL